MSKDIKAKQFHQLKETMRVKALQELNILDTSPEVELDRITNLAAEICQVPICLISLVDSHRQWFKSKVGLENCRETDRDISFCTHAIEQIGVFEVEDATKDENFKTNPLVVNEPFIVFYAGAPLVDSKNNAIGTLCVIDHKPRKLTESQKKSLKMLSQLAMDFISARVKYENKIHSLLNIEKLTQNTPGVLYQYQLFKDGRSCFPYASKKIFDVYEVQPHEVQTDATQVFGKLHSDDFPKIVDSIQKSAEFLIPWVLEYRVNLSKGTRWLKGYAIPEKLEDESILWHGYIQDITEEKYEREQLSKAARLASLGEMAGGIAHEINNPLAIIQSSVDYIKGHVDNDKLDNSFVRIDKTIQRISKIISSLQIFSQTRYQGELKEFPINKIILDAIRLCHDKIESNSIGIKLHISPKLNVDCRFHEMTQAILNLILNSIDAVCELEDRWISFETLFINDDSFHLIITDSGEIKSQLIKEKLMQPFFTTKELGDGSGLGLCLAKGIVEEHKGKFFFDPQSKNTTFVIELPIAQSQIISQEFKKVS